MTDNAAKPSVTFTILILFGLVLMLIGVVVTILGLGVAAPFSLKLDTLEVTTSNCGLAIMSIGALLSGFVATRLPAGVSVFSISQPSLLERFQAKAPLLLIPGILGLVACIFAAVHGR